MRFYQKKDLWTRKNGNSFDSIPSLVRIFFDFVDHYHQHIQSFFIIKKSLMVQDTLLD
ncbi:MAG: hypothetical protein ANABAC_0432 [Anaerolineae bacterium]|nr:MAG: hypothetical protein ANABAC_0432 [Anaerolineae bacterium]